MCKGVKKEENRLEKEKLVWMKIQFVTAINLLAVVLEFAVFRDESIEIRFQQAKAYTSTQESP